MAQRKKKKVQKIKFELTKSAIGGIGVVCFCIFLWMFLIGVWAGQSLLLPKKQSSSLENNAEMIAEERIVNLSNQKKKKPDRSLSSQTK